MFEYSVKKYRVPIQILKKKKKRTYRYFEIVDIFRYKTITLS